MPEGAPEARVIFMHADNPRQHSLALYNQPHPAGVVHLMVEVGTLDEVGMALDRVKQAGLPLLATLGRHINDNMCSFYVLAPGGIAVEYGYDGLLVKAVRQSTAFFERCGLEALTQTAAGEYPYRFWLPVDSLSAGCAEDSQPLHHAL